MTEEKISTIPCKICGKKIVQKKVCSHTKFEGGTPVVVNIPVWDNITVYIVCDNCIQNDKYYYQTLQMFAVDEKMESLEDDIRKIRNKYTSEILSKELLISILKHSKEEIYGESLYDKKGEPLHG